MTVRTARRRHWLVVFATPSKTPGSTTAKSLGGSASTRANSPSPSPGHGSSGSRRSHSSRNSPTSPPIGSRPDGPHGRLGDRWSPTIGWWQPRTRSEERRVGKEGRAGRVEDEESEREG